MQKLLVVTSQYLLKFCHTGANTRKLLTKPDRREILLNMQSLLNLPFQTRRRGLAFNEGLPQVALDIGYKTRTNGFAWRGQFSPQLVESLLMAYCPPGACVLDPFSGSGTSILEAAGLGLPAYGFEINPAAWLLTRVYTLCNLSDHERQAAIEEINLKINQLWLLRQNEVENEMRNLAASEGPIGTIVGALVILMDLFQNKITRSHCERILQKLSQTIRELPFSNEPLTAGRADARDLPLSTASVDFILTSPPYINVFNYHQHYRKSAEILGHDLLFVAKSEIGSNRANRGNRFITVTQYCLDIAAALKEMHRVCKPDARLILVLGHESKVLGVRFLNSELVAHIARRTKAFDLVLNQSRWYTNKFGLRIREDLLHLQPRELAATDWETVARSTAEVALNKGLRTVMGKNREALLEAISQVSTTQRTPFLNSNEQVKSASHTSSR
ncbi:MAG TPA: DNA methyltransferase [Verrucomicrobiae bacterium]|jgi:SAM-dependent methyltransferase